MCCTLDLEAIGGNEFVDDGGGSDVEDEDENDLVVLDPSHVRLHISKLHVAMSLTTLVAPVLLQ